MSSLIDSHIFKDIFGSAPMRGKVMAIVHKADAFRLTFDMQPETKEIWSDRSRTAYYLQWEAALARAQAKLGIIPQEACDEIVKQCDVNKIDFDKLKEQTELIGYPVLGVVQQLVSLCQDNLGGWAHWGATTQDVTDSATVLAIRDALDHIEAELDAIMASVARLAQEHRLTPSKPITV